MDNTNTYQKEELKKYLNNKIIELEVLHASGDDDLKEKAKFSLAIIRDIIDICQRRNRF